MLSKDERPHGHKSHPLELLPGFSGEGMGGTQRETETERSRKKSQNPNWKMQGELACVGWYHWCNARHPHTFVLLF